MKIMDLDAGTHDETLMGALLEGQPGALQQLYERYHGLLHSVAMNVVHNALDAEEILQDVFLHLWNRATRESRSAG
jgi:RNA polymerase sigma-70 factor (ECF subfamily)